MTNPFRPSAPAPACDVTHAHNPGPGKWTATQQLSVGGKREAISASDLIEARYRSRLKAVLKQVREALAGWARFGEQAGVRPGQIGKIKQAIQRACSMP